MLKRSSDVSQIKINDCLHEIVLFVLLIRLVQELKETKLKRSHARIPQTVLLLLRVSLKVARTYLYARVGYICF